MFKIHYAFNEIRSQYTKIQKVFKSVADTPAWRADTVRYHYKLVAFLLRVISKAFPIKQ